MELHDLQNVKGARHRKARVGRGRGSGKGKTSGKGHKGQMARSGHKHKLVFEGGQMPLVRRLPKRGFKNPLGTVYTPVNVTQLSVFEDGCEVSVEAMRKAGLANGSRIKIKILGRGGNVDRRLNVKAQAFSASARAMIETAGGTCEVVK